MSITIISARNLPIVRDTKHTAKTQNLIHAVVCTVNEQGASPEIRAAIDVLINRLLEADAVAATTYGKYTGDI